MTGNGVVCAIDVNDYDQDVVDLAARFARQFGVDLDLVHVTLFPDPTNAAWPAYLGSPDSLIQDNRKFRNVTTSVENVKVHFHHLSGTPSKQVLEFVDRNHPRMLVLGTHGRRGLARLVGSTASHILRHASCPVMILRQRKNSHQLSEMPSEAV
jgi:universal stress protein A